MGTRRFACPFPAAVVLRRSALLLILGQSLLFVAVLLITMARGLKIDCGCGLFMDRQVGPGALLEDAVLFGGAVIAVLEGIPARWPATIGDR
jgi:hypothetical protein